MLDSIDELRLFVAVFEEGSIRAASARLGMTAAGGSKRLLALEDRVGRRLFNRTTRKLSATTDGQTFYQDAQAILASVQEAERGLSDATEITGRLRITASASFAPGYLSSVISSYLIHYPKVVVELDPTDRTVDLVAEGIDLAIRHGVMADSTLIAQRVSPSRRLICASPRYWEQNGMPASPKELSDYDGLIIGKENRWTLARNGVEKTFRIRSRFESSMGEVVRQMAVDGHGVALLADWHVADDLRSGKLVEALADWTIGPPSGIYAVYPSRANIAPPVSSFIAHLKEWIAAHPVEMATGRR
ncbi:LysR family transcriptional regulator [Pseudomonas sp. 14P_8.1_Bac3]|uniref:LysR family transcriptional regulator n=1 Tax=Pseudomonas sp. 14P_8.1_Bac3 TaxID=2971621 RepID=UPI0021C8ACFC|nr:LysR family transcriptional regulator [Pseudomonas sp. 14P_8.1_Bac3]MCU1761116.1 LysR family transcriptional regulator [Pseudomonas sp. 14P_8.1_Bac3]